MTALPLTDGTAVRPHETTAEVVICVHDAIDDVRQCLTSVATHTASRHRLILVDDGSGPACRAELERFAAAQPAVTLLRNDEPEGYTRSANRGLREARADFVVLLNSDTIVTPDWLERLIECVASDSRIGIVGPLSNAATFQSVPRRFDTDLEWALNPLPTGWTPDDVAAVIDANAPRAFPRVGLINGFCFGITRAVIDAIGYFDEAAFPEAYGEEQDYCLRATRAGFTLAIADHAYVYHAWSRSYGRYRRQALKDAGSAALMRKHGEERIRTALEMTSDDVTLEAMREAVAHALGGPILLEATAERIPTGQAPASLTGTTRPSVVLYVVGGAGTDRHPAVRDFPLVNREKGESELTHLARVMRWMEEAKAAGGTHLLVPREQADWLGGHPLVADYLATHYDVAEASAETGIIFTLRPEKHDPDNSPASLRRSPAACTIIARNYLAQARTLAQSYAKHEPGGRFYILVVDGLPEGVEVGPDVRVISSQEIGLRDSDFKEMSFKYDSRELATAVKPNLLATILDQYEEEIIYFDPDILLFKPLDELMEILSQADIVLIPHLLHPIPLDTHWPRDQDILMAGAYNLGFIALRKSDQTKQFLRWWEKRLRDGCIADPCRGLMTDQKWIDLVPGLYPGTSIFRDETYNVAYWNITSRTIEKAKRFSQNRGQFLVDGKPLTFFHFSGFDPESRDTLSRYDSRTQIDNGSALEDLINLYADLLLENGYPIASRWRYGFDRFSNGININPVLRRLYLDQNAGARKYFGDPFDANDPNSFYSWVTDSEHGQLGLSPFLDRIYHSRHYLGVAFPDVAGSDRMAFLDWARTEGAAEFGYDPALVRADNEPGSLRNDASNPVSGSMNRSAGRRAHTKANSRDDFQNSPKAVEDESGEVSPWPSPARVDGRVISDAQVRVDGVHVTGYFGRENGLGVAARGYVRALDHLGVPVALHDLSHHERARGSSGHITIANRKFSTWKRFGVNLICVNPREHFQVVEELGDQHFQNHYNIGVWAWELPTFPVEWRHTFAYYDEIWVGTSFVASALAPVSPIPIVRIPPAIVPMAPGSRARGRRLLNVASDEFMFLFIFSFTSYFERKNPLAVIDAFTRAFSPADPVRLVVKSVNEDFSPDDFAGLHALAKKHRISIHTGYWTPDQMRDLMAACDTYVSLHRSEGTGLTIADAMALGKPVIGTAWSGNTDFMNVSNSFPVRYRLVPLEKDIGPYHAGETWAEPSVEHAAELMRRVFEDRDQAGVLGLAAQAEIETNYSTESVARLIQERLAVIARRGGARQGWEETNGSMPLACRVRDTVAARVPLDAVTLYVVGGSGSEEHPAVRNFPLMNRRKGQSEATHLAQVIQLVDETLGAGGTHLLVPGEHADWLGDHPLVADYFAAHHELAEASPETGIIFRLLPPDP